MARRNKGPVFTSLEKTSILSLSTIFFFRMFGLFLVLPLFSLLALDLQGATPALIGLALGAYGLTQATLQIPFGLWSDRIGRKPVIAFGLVLFIIGSAMAAVADDVYWMIAARLLQGAGAISSAIFALIADLTRPEVRARANAGLGASVGLAFGLAFLIAPFLGHWVGLSGIFWLITLMASISLLVLLFAVPAPPQMPTTRLSTREIFRTVLNIPPLRVINFGTFVCNVGLSMTFFVTPLVLNDYGFAKSELWKVYLPMLFCGGVAMVMAAIIAETRNRFRQVMLVGILFLLSSFVLSWVGKEVGSLPVFLVALFIFFMGFNVFEPIFPSLLTRITTPQTKGTASGIYSFCHFIGNFVGAMLSGLLYHAYPSWLFLLLVVLASLFFYFTLSFPNPDRKPTPPLPEEDMGVVTLGK